LPRNYPIERNQLNQSISRAKNIPFLLNGSIKPVMKASRVETIETARKEYAELLKEGWKKTSIFRSDF